MSTTYTIVCDKCKVKADAGHSSRGNKTFYGGAGDFAFKHLGHPLRVMLDDDYDEYQAIYRYKQDE